MNREFANTLTLRAEAARRRLAELEAEASTGSAREGRTAKTVLREVTDVLDELQTATEELEVAMDDVVAARAEFATSEQQYAAFKEALPMAYVLTTGDGCIEEANTRAATLLNVNRRYLSGKPLLLFLPERERFFGLVEMARERGTAEARLMLRPREMRPRPAQIGLSTLAHQWCWLIHEVGA